MPSTMRRVSDAIAETPLALLPSWFSRIRGEAVLVALDGPHGGATRVGSVSILPVYGVIEHRSDWLMEMFGEGTSITAFRDALRAELADPAVKAVVLDVDSPGGSIAGVTEFAAEIRAQRGGGKPIVAVADTLAASAAYWLASQADELVVTPSGHVGSIGVYAIHQDVSRLLDELGVTMTIISAGPYKTEGNEFEPLTDDARAEIQSRVDASYEQFLADVAAGRRVSVADVRDNYGGGRVFTARDAKAAGMVDRIETLSQTVARLGRATTGGRRMVALGLVTDLAAGAIPRHETATDDGPWDGAMMESRCPAEEGPLRASHAWVDSEGDPNLKGSYKFIHHEVAEDGSVGAANLTACSTGIGYLNRPAGSTGRPNIPDGDRAGVHRHLAGHLTDAGREAPALTGQTPSIADRLISLVSEGNELIDAVQRRAAVRAADHQPAISTVTERSLRALRETIDVLLEPGEPDASATPTDSGEPNPAASSTPPTAAPTPARFRSREDFLRHIGATAP